MNEKFKPGNKYWVVLRGLHRDTLCLVWAKLDVIHVSERGTIYIFGNHEYPDATRAAAHEIFETRAEAINRLNEMAHDLMECDKE